MNLFKPKWKRKDPVKRISWIEICDTTIPENQKILEYLVRNDNNINVCIAAVDKIKDPILLKDFVLSDVNIRICTKSYFNLDENDRISLLSHIRNKELLKEVFLTESDAILEKVINSYQIVDIIEDLIIKEDDFSKKQDLQKKYINRIKDPGIIKDKLYKYNVSGKLLEDSILRLSEKDIDELFTSFCLKNLNLGFLDDNCIKAVVKIGKPYIPYLEDKIWLSSDSDQNFLRALKALDADLGNKTQYQLSKANEDFLQNPELQMLFKYWNNEAKKWWSHSERYEAVCDWCGTTRINKNHGYKKRSDLVCQACISKGLTFSNVHNLQNYVGIDQYNNALQYSGGDTSSFQSNSLTYSLIQFMRSENIVSEEKLNKVIARINKQDWAVNVFTRILMEMAYDRAKNIITALMIAREIGPSPLFLRQIAKLRTLPQEGNKRQNHDFTPELTGSTNISWSDTTYTNVQSITKEIVTEVYFDLGIEIVDKSDWYKNNKFCPIEKASQS